MLPVKEAERNSSFPEMDEFYTSGALQSLAIEMVDAAALSALPARPSLSPRQAGQPREVFY